MKLELYYPVKPFIVGQKFGETAFLSYYKDNGITFAGHNGLDLAALHGQEVRAAHDGTCYPEVDSKQGHGVVLITDVPCEYKGGTAFFKTIYWHLIDNIVVKWGQQVKAGDLLGYADSTGLSTGDHLHFGLKPMTGKDPYEGLNLEQQNGYMGAIDPMPYFNGKFADDLNPNKFIFSKDLELGQTSTDVYQLQSKLKKLGYFPATQVCTNFYGSITRAAVFLFQQDYIVNLSWAARYIYKGRYCSQQTRAALNQL
jgi:murein DD-endopeptidase MepM/ murein hydrolase activator NlpD